MRAMTHKTLKASSTNNMKTKGIPDIKRNISDRI